MSVSAATRLGLSLLGAGLALGVLADLVLRATPLGVNAFLFALALVAAAVWLVRREAVELEGGRAWLALPVLVFSALLVWRDSPWLVALNVFAVAVAVALATFGRAGFRLAAAGLADYARAGTNAFGGLVKGTGSLVLGEIQWNEISRGSGTRQAAAVGRGLAIAVPLLFVFGGLFVAADAVFKGFVTGLAPSDLGEPATHLLAVAVGAWASAGLLRELAVPADGPFEASSRAPRLRLGGIEVGIALALLDLLFLAFVLVQLRYLFGGEALVEARTQLTYAEYARAGFFELVAVALLVLPVILVADHVLRRDHPRHERLFRVLAAALVALLLVVMASALERMRLYQNAYGLTELRVYATGFMLWLAVVFAWTCATVLRGRRRRFAVGALVSGFAAILAINVLNPDALIARVNIERANRGADVDTSYLARLSDDAVPAIVARLPELPRAEGEQLAALLLERERSDDWRTWNWSRARADDRRDELLRAR